MYNLNYVCFQCRHVRRAAKHVKPRCQSCGSDMSCIGLIRPPKKGRALEWERLFREYCASKQHGAELTSKANVQMNRQYRATLVLLDNRNLIAKSGRRRHRKALRVRKQS